MAKHIFKIRGMKKMACYWFFIVGVSFFGSCRELLGKYSLGNHLSLWDNDRKEERIVVYCEGECNGGIYVVPTYARHYDSARKHYAEYVETARSNKKWVIVKTLHVIDNKENYYIISKTFNIEHLDCAKANCDSILQSHVIGPLDLAGFQERAKILQVNLGF
jgi:hypothetical protein